MSKALRAEISVFHDVSAEQPLFWNGVRLVDPVDRVLAGDKLEEVACYFNLEPEEIRLALHIFAAAAGRVSKSLHYLLREGAR